MPKYVEKAKIEALDRAAMEMLCPEDREEYEKRFGLVADDVESRQEMSLREKQLDRILRKRFGDGIQNRKHLMDVVDSMAELCGLPKIPKRAVCENHVAPFDALSDVFFGEVSNYLWHACRHGYKTLGNAFLIFLESTQHNGCRSKILGGSDEQSKNVYGYINTFDDIPVCHEQVAVVLTKKSTFNNGSEISTLTQSMKSVRGPHVQKLRLDEIEEFDAQVFRSSLSITHGFGGIPASIGMSSTHHKRHGIMAELLKNHKQKGITLFSWCIFEIMEQCKEKSCEMCKSHTKRDMDGNIVSFYDVCKGKAKKSRGYMPLSEVLEKFTMLTLEDFLAEWCCDIVSLSGFVFPKFIAEEDELHVTNTAIYDPNLPVARLWDFGWSGATAVLWWQPETLPSGLKRRRVIDEEWYTQVPLPEIVKHVKAKPYPSIVAKMRDYGDPSGKGEKNKIIGVDDITYLKSQGINIESRKSFIPVGVRLINEALEVNNEETGLIINPKCNRLIEYMSGAKYPCDAFGKPISEIPIKDGKEHSGDALRYGFINETTVSTEAAWGGANPDGTIITQDGDEEEKTDEDTNEETEDKEKQKDTQRHREQSNRARFGISGMLRKRGNSRLFATRR